MHREKIQSEQCMHNPLKLHGIWTGDDFWREGERARGVM